MPYLTSISSSSMGNHQHEYGKEYADLQISKSQNPIRRKIKDLYVRRVLRRVDGSTIDIGCGAGQILERLPFGSVGVETNQYLISYLQSRNLNVIFAQSDSKSLLPAEIFKFKGFRSVVLSHVLEHFANADKVLRQLLQNCRQLGIETVVLVVPGRKGYQSDATHNTFIDISYLKNNNLWETEGFRITESSYFPVNLQSFGDFFAYNELMIVYSALV